jgi:hypothetical protein
MTVKCPATGVQIFPDAAMLLMAGPTRILCPACDRTHLWDPHRRHFIPDQPEDNAWMSAPDSR